MFMYASSKWSPSVGLQHVKSVLFASCATSPCVARGSIPVCRLFVPPFRYLSCACYGREQYEKRRRIDEMFMENDRQQDNLPRDRAASRTSTSEPRRRY